MLAKGRGGKIRAPRRGLTRDDVDFDATWNVLATAFSEIHSKNASKLSFEELFRNAYKLVLKKKQDLLYEKVSQLEEEWLRGQVRVRITELITPVLLSNATEQGTETRSIERRIAGERFMGALKDAFNDHQLCMGMITDVLMYMDRMFNQDGRRPSIFATAMALFRKSVLRAPINDGTNVEILSLLERSMLDMIKMERQGETIDRNKVRACCYMLEGLYETFAEEESSKLYLTSFEPKFLAASRAFYRQEGQQVLAEADASTFCHRARQRLREEEERCQQTIAPITEAKIKAVVDKEFIQAHIRDVINMEGTGVRDMLDNEKIQDLANVYDLIARVDGRKLALKESVQKRVIELGNDINNAANVMHLIPQKWMQKSAPERPHGEKAAPEKPVNQQTQAAITWVEQILELKAKYDKLLDKAFQKDIVMEKALEVSFQDFINANDRSSEHLSLFLDDNLKKGNKSKSEAEIDALLDKGILLLQYLANKDLFETYYKKHMAKRLLMKKSISRDMERQMLSKMKMKIGNQITQKSEGMLKDMDLSDNMNGQYKDYVGKLGDPDPKRVELDARILTTTVWPFESLFRADDEGEGRKLCKWPSAVDRVRQRFEKFYLDKHTGRKLTWRPSLGDADVRAVYKGRDGKIKRYELNVPTYTMVILMLFNDLPAGQSLSFAHIEQETNMTQQDLIKNLGPICLVSKWRLLKKEPQSKEILPTDVFYFNEEFSSPFVKIKITPISGGSNKVESNEERKETQKKADEERGHAIEAAVVRIMKQRKNLGHQMLMTEVLQQLSTRFQPDVNMIKRKIESLIDREYLERGPDPAKPSYIYLA